MNEFVIPVLLLLVIILLGTLIYLVEKKDDGKDHVIKGRITPHLEEDSNVILVKRTKASLRHPGRPTETRYDEYKTESGLYGGTRAGRKGEIEK